jgi:hypothetical protein
MVESILQTDASKKMPDLQALRNQVIRNRLSGKLSDFDTMGVTVF